MRVPKFVNDICKSASKHSPAILTGLGVAGMITTVIFAVKATPKAVKMLEKEKKKKGEDLTPVETVKATWKCYIPAAVSGVVSIACVIGANSVNARRNAALAAAYSMSESALKTYKDKVRETIGEKKEKEIRDEIAKDQVRNDPPTNKEVYITGLGETLCFDPITGRYFMCSIEKLKRVERELNEMVKSSSDGMVRLNDYYFKIGLKTIDMGDFLVWTESQLEAGDYLVNRGPVELDLSSCLTEDDRPCLVVGFWEPPTYLA